MLDSKSPFSSNNNNNSFNSDASNFECNICFDLTQDPIVTLCGHLFCWPCLYKWLHFHRPSNECPLCKATIEEEKLIPLYGKGKMPHDPTSNSISGIEIPHRPTGQTPETTPSLPEPNYPDQGLGFMGGLGRFVPFSMTRFGNFVVSVASGGLFPSVLDLLVDRLLVLLGGQLLYMCDCCHGS